MGKFGSFLMGAGIGAAQAYAGKKSKDASEARIAAMARGDKPPVEANPLDGIVDKVKGFFADKAPDPSAAPVAVANPSPDNRPTFNVSLAEQAAAAPPKAALPSEETIAFNDDATVPNEPIPFENSYA